MGRAWLRTIAANPEVILVGLVDLDEALARQAATDHGFTDVVIGTDLGAVLAATGADAVVNVTIPIAHRPVSEQALAAGLDVLCEKPLADSMIDAYAMVEAAAASGRLLMVSQSRRYWRQLVTFRRQIAQLGPIGSVTCTFFKAPHFGGFREVMAEPLLVDMAVHQFDLARLIIGDDPTAVYCESYNPRVELVRRERGRQRDVHLRRRHPVRLHRQLVRAGPGDLVERRMAGQRRAGHGDLGRRSPAGGRADRRHRAAGRDRHRTRGDRRFARRVRGLRTLRRPPGHRGRAATSSAWPWLNRPCCPRRSTAGSSCPSCCPSRRSWWHDRDRCGWA